jgi:hypothetical protein
MGDCSVAVMIFAIYFAPQCSVAICCDLLVICVARRFAYECLHQRPQYCTGFLSALAASSADEAALLQQNGCSDSLSPPDLHECDRAPGRPTSRLA